MQITTTPKNLPKMCHPLLKDQPGLRIHIISMLHTYVWRLLSELGLFWPFFSLFLRSWRWRRKDLWPLAPPRAFLFIARILLFPLFSFEEERQRRGRSPLEKESWNKQPRQREVERKRGTGDKEKRKEEEESSKSWRRGKWRKWGRNLSPARTHSERRKNCKSSERGERRAKWERAHSCFLSSYATMLSVNFPLSTINLMEIGKEEEEEKRKEHSGLHVQVRHFPLLPPPKPRFLSPFTEWARIGLRCQDWFLQANEGST